jgi:hypothetical protein
MCETGKSEGMGVPHPEPNGHLPEVLVGGKLYPARRLKSRVLAFIARRGERGASARECVGYIYKDDEDGGPLWADHCIYVTAWELKSTGLIYGHRRRYYHHSVKLPKAPRARPKVAKPGGRFNRTHRGKGRSRCPAQAAAS